MTRKPSYPVNALFPNRWSPRALSGEPITEKELFTLFEAARWAPSSNNNQLWRFVYAKRETPHWPGFFNLLSEKNKSWCFRAAVLVLIISRTNAYYQNKPQRTHSFEAGAAFENMALQGSLMGLVVHGMGGFDYDNARQLLQLSELWNVECMVAIGRPGKKEDLPPDLQEREMPSDRKPLNEILFEGTFKE